MFEVQHRNFTSARSWYVRRSQIDMEPKYQRRGSLWKLEDRQSLIDTMINGFDMPKLYVADFTTIRTELNEKSLRFSVVDGKQRLESIFSFFDNNYPLSANFVYYDDLDIDLSGLYYKDIKELSSEIASKVEEFPLPVMHVVTDDHIKIRELFLRLNKGLVLTGPEKRNAMLGDVPEIIAEIAEHDFFSICTSYQSVRGQHLNTAAKLLAFELSDAPTDTKKVSLDGLVQEYSDAATELAVARSEALEILDRMTIVFGRKDSLLKSAGQIPVYYWLIRSVSFESTSIIRRFLELFQKSIDNNDFMELNSGYYRFDSADYKRALRSINDRWSHELRYKTLLDAFESFSSDADRVKNSNE